MKIIIEVEGTHDQQPEIRRVSSVPMEQSMNSISSLVSTSSPIDAGHARVPDAYVNETAAVTGSQQSPGSFSPAISGAIDAGAARVQQEAIPAVAMPDTGNMETVNTGNVYSGGSFANTGSN